MSANPISDRPASLSLLRILAMVIFGYIVMGNVVALLVISLLYPGNLMEAMADPVAHPDIRNVLVLAQGLASLVGLVLIPAWYLAVLEKRSIRPLFVQWPSLRWTGVLAAVIIALALAISPVAEWNANMELPSWTGGLGDTLKAFEDQAAALVKTFVSDLSPATFLMVFVVIAVIPGIGEELVFRGLIQNELQRVFRNPHAAIWVAAALFSAFHLQFFGFFPRLLIGALLGYLYYWSGNLWIPVLGHFLNNAMQVTAIYLMQLKVHSFDVESTESAPWPLVVISLLMLAGLLYYCKKNLNPTPTPRDIPPAIQ
jgi:membrane protease YdiL (CAAX protease family)